MTQAAACRLCWLGGAGQELPTLTKLWEARGRGCQATRVYAPCTCELSQAATPVPEGKRGELGSRGLVQAS
jgi:hypothetical protein